MKFHDCSLGTEPDSVKTDEVVEALVTCGTLSGHPGNVNRESQSRSWNASLMLVEP